ncbi:hypothetical protein HOE04_00855 [archaeon]|jgi:hypothetical protein|nr:hypothetical protein [archaeon]
MDLKSVTSYIKKEIKDSSKRLSAPLIRHPYLFVISTVVLMGSTFCLEESNELKKLEEMLPSEEMKILEDYEISYFRGGLRELLKDYKLEKRNSPLEYE